MRQALDRALNEICEPVLVQYSHEYRLLDIYNLLLAQSKQFSILQTQLGLINEELEQRVADRTDELVQANKDLQKEITERTRAEEMLEIRLEYERSLTYCANALLAAGDSEGTILETLKYLYSAAQVSRVILGRHFDLGSCGPCIRILHQVQAQGNIPIPYRKSILPLKSFGKWIDQIWENQWIVGHSGELGEVERQLLDKLGLTSILLLPIGESDNWYGIIAFGKTLARREWDNDDIQLLRTVSKTLYAYFERRRNASVVAKARDESLQASKFKDELLARVSHELRTPLSAILGYAQLLAYGSYGKLNPGQRDAAHLVVSSSKYLSTLVNGILNQAQLESGQLILQNAPYDVRGLIHEVEGRIRILAQENGLDFLVEVADEIPEVFTGDKMRLQQVLTNLLGNAVKFTESGEIGLGVYVTEDKYLCYVVRDTGPGIPVQAQRRIFEPFMQVDGTLTRKINGTGLGLSITKQLLRLMRGKIELESEEGTGSIFRIKLPLPKEAELQQEEEILTQFRIMI